MKNNHSILIIDDDPDIREILADMLLMAGYQVEEASDGFEALAKIRLGCHLIITDIVMPGMDGFEIIKKIRSDPEYSDLPILVVTAITSKEQRLKAIELGANDFIIKPLDQAEVLIRVASLLRVKDYQDTIKQHKTELEKMVEQRTAQLREALEKMAEAQRKTYEAYLETIQKLAIAAEYKDEGTAEHIKRISLYSECLARALKLSPYETELVRHASPMHDVGKIGIPEGILLKADQLTPEEWKMMQQHTVIGARILQGSSSELLKAGEIIALTHHERYDGQGYPQGLKGEQIPLFGRIVAVADVFDALTTNRPYKKAFSNQEAVEIIKNGSGTHFDPQIVQAFLNSMDEILAIQSKYKDKPKKFEIDIEKLRY